MAGAPISISPTIFSLAPSIADSSTIARPSTWHRRWAPIGSLTAPSLLSDLAIGSELNPVTCVILILAAGLAGQAAGQDSEFALGRQYYAEGEFGKAAAHF